MKTHKPSAIEMHANITGNWQDCVEMAWEQLESKPGLKQVDWLGLEAVLGAYAIATNNDDVGEIVASFTGRGNPLRHHNFNVGKAESPY